MLLLNQLKTVGDDGLPVSPELRAKSLPLSVSSEEGEAVSSRAAIGARVATVEWADAMLYPSGYRRGGIAGVENRRDCGGKCSFEVYGIPTK